VAPPIARGIASGDHWSPHGSPHRSKRRFCDLLPDSARPIAIPPLRLHQLPALVHSIECPLSPSAVRMVHRRRGNLDALSLDDGELDRAASARDPRTPPTGPKTPRAVRFRLPNAETLNLEVTDDSPSPRHTTSYASSLKSPPNRLAAPAPAPDGPTHHRSPRPSAPPPRLTIPTLRISEVFAEDAQTPRSPSASPRIVGPPVRSLGEIKSSLRGSAINLLRQRSLSPASTPEAAAAAIPLPSRITSDSARLRERRADSASRLNFTLDPLRVCP